MTKTAFHVSDCYKVNCVFPDYTVENKIAERVNRNIKYLESELKSLQKSFFPKARPVSLNYLTLLVFCLKLSFHNFNCNPDS